MVDHRHRCSDCQRVLAEIAGSCGPRGPPPRRVRGGLRRLSGEHSPRGPPPYTAGRPYMAGLSWGGIVLAQQCFANYTARMRMSSQDLAVVTDSPRRLTWLGILLSDNLRTGGCIISAARARHHRQTLASAFSHGPIPSSYSAPCRTGLSLHRGREGAPEREGERERERERPCRSLAGQDSDAIRKRLLRGCCSISSLASSPNQHPSAFTLFATSSS